MDLHHLVWRATLGGVIAALAWTSAAVAQPSFGGPESFLSRMDQNGNGLLEPSEVSDRMRGFLERIAQGDRSINLSRPVPIRRLTEAMERARRERERSGGSSWGGRDRGRDEDRDRRRDGDVAAPEPLVPGFGGDDLPPVPGFGEDAALMVQVTERDQREAAERMERYDRNRDGFLDQQELARGRWDGSPFEYDRNRDGRLSRDELALRYAKRRIEEENEDEEEDQDRDRRDRGSFFARGGPPSGFSTWGRSSSSGSSGGLDPRMEGIVNSVMGRYDRNRNGTLDRDEWSQMRSDPSGGDRNRDGRISKEELGAWLSARMSGAMGGGDRGGDGNRGRGGWGSDRGGSDRERRWGGFSGGPPSGGFFGGPPGGAPESGRPNFFAMRGGWGGDQGEGDRGEGDDRNRRGDRRGDSRSGAGNTGANGVLADTRPYRFQSAEERIANQFDDLPGWFSDSDANGDGQIAMSEYASEWPESKMQEFLSLDANGDGVITPAECIAAVERGFRAGSTPSSGNVSSGGSSRAASPTSGASGGYTEAQGPSASGGASSAAARYAAYAQGLIRQYDKNQDGVLDKTEAAGVKVLKSDADANGDGQITAEEIARALQPKR